MKFFNFKTNFIEICCLVYLQQVDIVSGSSFAPNRWQAIIWTSDLTLPRHMLSLGLNGQRKHNGFDMK